MITLIDALTILTVDNLKGLLSHLPDPPRVTRKGDLIVAIKGCLSGTSLRSLWEGLDNVQKLAVSEALHSPGGVFRRNQFLAKYGQLPAFTTSPHGRSGVSYAPPTLLKLFLYWQDGGYRIPVDLLEPLKAFVPAPVPAELKTAGELPSCVGDEPLVIRQCEREAMLDLAVMLRLADQGRVQVSDKTSLPGAATFRLVSEKLSGCDFYSDPPKKSKGDQEIGPIKAFAWPVLLRASGLVQQGGSKLSLAPAGLKALGAAPAEVLRAIWKKWLKTTLLDEFSRINEIKGQKSKGRVMAAAAPRRAVISEALRECPVGEWVEVDAFSRYMQATGMIFQVTHDPQALYIIDRNYGSLGYDGSHGWNMLQLRYLLVLLFEYAATLGMIDVAYTPPEHARSDYRDLWGADDLAFLSRYDGLCYFRLTPLGAYCLDLCADYVPAPSQSNLRLSVLPSLTINVREGEMSPEEALALEAWANPGAEGCWRLDREKTIAAIERGLDVLDLKAFLEARDDQPLPETVEAFLKTSQKHGRALKMVGMALLIQCQNAETAETIATHKETAGLCLRAGECH